MKTIDDLGELTGKRVLVRSDLNVPLADGVIGDDGRIRASLATITRLANLGARVVVMAHLGRPKGKPDPQFSLRPVADRLAELLPGYEVRFAADTVGDQAQALVGSLPERGIVLLENVRFDPRETSKDEGERGSFADELAALGDAFVSDGFGVVHRKQASVFDIAARLPHAAGELVLAEVRAFRRVLDHPDRPYVVVLGGSKVSDKLGVIDNLLGKVDRLLIGGGMCFTFLAAQGHGVGGSLLEDDQVDTVRGFLRRATDLRVDLVLPVDIVVAKEISDEATTAVVPADAIPADQKGLDIGPRTVQLFKDKLVDAETVIWNGPMGVFEVPSFAVGTNEIARAIAAIDGTTVVGGGDSAAAIRQLGLDHEFTHISTGGGASLELLEGKALPGLTVLED